MKSDSKPEECTVGIDLGTTRSVVAHLDEFGRPRTILNSEGDLTTPSAVLFEPGNVVVGREALRALAATPEVVAQFAKRELGNAQFSMTFDGVNYPPEMIQSLILGKLRRDAERFLGQSVQSAVITVPAFFDEPKRRATIDAGLLGGLEVKAIINEPTAAAIAFGAAKGMLDSKGAFQTPQTILVYDLGGGTFDVSLLRIEGKSVDVLAISGNSRLGGIDWDKCLVDWMGQQFETEHGVEPAEIEAAHANLLREAEELKHALSARTSVPVRAKLGGAVLRSVLTRKEFSDLTAHLLDRTRFTVKKLLQDAEKKWAEIDRVLLVGGSTRMPQVREMLEKEAGDKIDDSLSPEEAVAHGAAVFAKIVHQRESGSADDTEDLEITDVNAHHLGVIGVERATGRHFRQVMIGKNTPLPAKKSARFETAHDGQANVLVRIVEGGDARGQHATMIGKLVIYNLPRGLPARTPVDVCVRYDRDGIIEVEAEVPSTGSKASVRIERAAGLSAEEKESLRDRNEEILEALGLD